ncbi:MAG: carboxymuconolactone decarboxylase family protein [Planctomycetota bacterium]
MLDALPDYAKDLKLNLKSVLRDASVTPAQRYGAAATAAIFAGKPDVAAAIVAGSEGAVDENVAEDAKAAASLMGMTTVYYRSVHMLGKDDYEQLPPKLRLQRMFAVKTDKPTFEMFELAAAAVAGCERCLAAHEKNLRDEGVTTEQVHDLIRIAAIVHGVCVALVSAEG